MGTSLLPSNKPSLSVLREFNNTEIAKTLVGHWRTFGPAVRAARTGFAAAAPSLPQLFPRCFGERAKSPLGNSIWIWNNADVCYGSAAPISKHAQPGLLAMANTVIGKTSSRVACETARERRSSAGKSVFELRCAQCHFAGGTGHRVGPELTGMSHRSVEDLLSNILDPNMAINPAYITYNCETTSGELETGLLQSESAETVTLCCKPPKRKPCSPAPISGNFNPQVFP